MRCWSRAPSLGVRAGWSASRRAALIACAVGAGWAGATVLPLPAGVAAEPHGTQPGEAAAAGGSDRAEREAMRERMLRRVFELNSRAEMYQQAITRLECGESVESVREFIRQRGMMVGRLLGDAEAPREVERLEGRPPHEGPRRGHARPGDPWRERMESGAPLTEEEREVIRDMMLTTEPELWLSLEDLKKKHPEEAEERMRRLLPVAGLMIELRRRDPELYRLRLEQMRYERQVLRIVERLAEAETSASRNEAELARLRAELHQAGSRAFDMRIAIQAHEIARLQERLDTVRSDITAQESKREELIAHHIEQVLEAARRKRHDDLHGGPRHDMEKPPPPPARAAEGDRPRRR